MKNTLPKSFQWINHFRRYEGNPILRPSGSGYCADAVFNPGATVKDGKIRMICRCINFANKAPSTRNWSVSCFGWAESVDGFHFDLRPEPIPEFTVRPGNPYQGGFEDPRLQKIGDTWMLTYTGVYPEPAGKFNKMTPGLAAFSKDLEHWELVGEILPARAIAVTDRKINGKYRAYWGNSEIYPAWSEDLIHWKYSIEPVLKPRPGFFDSELCEAAAAPIVNDDGILLVYNGCEIASEAQRSARLASPSYMPVNSKSFYSVGWALFDRDNPARLIARAAEPFLKPEMLYEFYGIAPFTCFAQGLVEFHNKYILYYGCADMRIAAVYSDGI